MQRNGNRFHCEMLQCNRMFITRPYCAGRKGITMSQQLQISSVFSVLALAALCIVASTTDHFGGAANTAPTLVQAEMVPGLPG